MCAVLVHFIAFLVTSKTQHGKAYSARSVHSFVLIFVVIRTYSTSKTYYSRLSVEKLLNGYFKDFHEP